MQRERKKERVRDERGGSSLEMVLREQTVGEGTLKKKDELIFASIEQQAK